MRENMTPKTFLEVILVCVLLAAWSVNVHTEFHGFVNIHLDFYRESSFGFIFYTESLFPGVRNVKSVCKVTACTGCFHGASFCSSIVPRHYMEPTFGEYCSCGPTSTQITMLRNRLIGRMARVTGVYSSVLNCQSRSEMRSSDINCFLRHQRPTMSVSVWTLALYETSYQNSAIVLQSFGCELFGLGYLLRKCFSGRHLNIVSMNPGCQIRT